MWFQIIINNFIITIIPVKEYLNSDLVTFSFFVDSEPNGSKSPIFKKVLMSLKVIKVRGAFLIGLNCLINFNTNHYILLLFFSLLN